LDEIATASYDAVDESVDAVVVMRLKSSGGEDDTDIVLLLLLLVRVDLFKKPPICLSSFAFV
jgi:hypothetical protein